LGLIFALFYNHLEHITMTHYETREAKRIGLNNIIDCRENGSNWIAMQAKARIIRAENARRTAAAK